MATQSIIESLRFLLVECTSASYKSDISLTFLHKTCALAQNVIKNENARQKNRLFFTPVLSFLNEFVKIHGATFETIISTKQLSAGDTESASNPTEEDKTMYRCIDSLAHETIKAITSLNLLGSDWISVQAPQGNGQSASETKCRQPLPHKSATFCSSGLAPFFSFLRTCTIECPAFLLHILAFEGPESHDDESADDGPGLLVFRKALETAVSSIIDVEGEISICAMSFLESVTSLAEKANANNTETSDSSITLPTKNAAIQRVAGEYNLAFQTNMLSILLRGTCGMLQSYVVPDACRLLVHALSKSHLSEQEFKAIVKRGLSQDIFFLGNRARCVVFDFCLPLLGRSNNNAAATTATTAPSLESMESMITDVWRLHRFEDVDMIERSDAVHAFCLRYGRRNPSATSTSL